MPQCLRFRVSGRVQGVFYRASTEAMASSLGLTGWVRNCANGDVELVACGAPVQLEALEKWLWQGPPHARVTGVQRTPVTHEVYPDFRVTR
jgi:acylphosphatase